MIAVIPTGGTIACTGKEGGLTPYFGREFAQFAIDVARSCGAEITIVPFEDRNGNIVVCDSSMMGPIQWIDLHRQIEQFDTAVDACVVLHGSDTMTFTGSALALLEPRRRLPVILTGSQQPFSSESSDAPDNLALALGLAMRMGSALRGDTVIAFGGKVHRAVHAQKTASSASDAFTSDQHITIDDSSAIDIWQKLRPTSGQGIVIDPRRKVYSINPTPGLDWYSLRPMLDTGEPGALLLNLWGIGSTAMPRSLKNLCAAASERGWPCLVRSQCLTGGTRLHSYDSTTILRDPRIIDGHHITESAATVKLMMKYDGVGLIEQIQRNVAGEFGTSEGHSAHA